jgi:hypothetical protein
MGIATGGGEVTFVNGNDFYHEMNGQKGAFVKLWYL